MASDLPAMPDPAVIVGTAQRVRAVLALAIAETAPRAADVAPAVAPVVVVPDLAGFTTESAALAVLYGPDLARAKTTLERVAARAGRPLNPRAPTPIERAVSRMVKAGETPSLSVRDILAPRTVDLSGGRGSRAVLLPSGLTRATMPAVDRGQKPTPEHYGRGAPVSPFNPMMAHQVFRAYVRDVEGLTFTEWVRFTRDAVKDENARIRRLNRGRKKADKVAEIPVPTFESLRCTVPTPAQVCAMLDKMATVPATLTNSEGRTVKAFTKYNPESLQALKVAVSGMATPDGEAWTVKQRAPEAVRKVARAFKPVKRTPQPAPAGGWDRFNLTE